MSFELILLKNYGENTFPLTLLSHASTIGFCLVSSSFKYPLISADGMLNVAETVSPIFTSQFETTTDRPRCDSPTQP